MDIEKKTIETKTFVDFKLSTCMEIHIPYQNSNTIFVYAGNNEGQLFFAQFKNEQLMFQNKKHIHSSIMMDIIINSKGLFLAFLDSQLIGLEQMNFTPFMNIKTNALFQLNTDCLTTSFRGIFYIIHKKQIKLQTLWNDNEGGEGVYDVPP